MSDLIYRTTNLGSVELDAISGRQSIGRPYLEFHMTCRLRAPQRTGQPPIAHIAWMGGEVETPAGTICLHPLIQEVALCEQDYSFVLRADLEERQLRVLDDSRKADSSVPFVVHFRALVHGYAGVLPAYACCRTTLNQTDWLEVLRSATREDRFAIEAVIQTPHGTEPLARAALEFRAARASFEQRDTTPVLTACREVFEHLPQVTTAGLDRDWQLDERIGRVHAAVRHMMHAGAHNRIGKPSPAQARLSIALTATLLDYYNRRTLE